MIIKKQEDVTPVVVDAYKNIADARLREIVASLIKHLHGFARDVHLTEEEFQAGTQIIAKMGQMTNATHNEVVLMSGSTTATTARLKRPQTCSGPSGG
jgi:catechol 1,2-dioxygenase